MKGNGFFFLWIDDPAFFLKTAGYPIDGLAEIIHIDRVPFRSSRVQRRFIDEVGQIGTRKSGRTRGDDLEVDTGRKGHLFAVNLKYFLSPNEIRTINRNVTIETL